MSRPILNLLIICLINVVFFKNIACISSVSFDDDRLNIKQIYFGLRGDIKTINNLLVEEKQATTSVIGSLHDVSSNKEFFQLLIKLIDVIQLNNYQYEAIKLYDNDDRMKTWFLDQIKDNNTRYQLDIIKKTVPILMNVIAEKFQQDINNEKDSKRGFIVDGCEQYKLLKRKYHNIIWHLLQADIKLLTTSTYCLWLHYPSLNKTEEYKAYVDSYAYLLDDHVSRVKNIVDKALDIGTNITGHLQRCAQSVLADKSVILLRRYQMSYADDWRKVMTVIPALRQQ